LLFAAVFGKPAEAGYYELSNPLRGFVLGCSVAADWRDWRRIVVGGEPFRWQSYWTDTRIRSEVNPKHLLIVRDQPFAQPPLVAAWIAVALARGWCAGVPRMELIGADGSRVPLEANAV
jgi:hypothetical protein